jgi:hypothetical protein
MGIKEKQQAILKQAQRIVENYFLASLQIWRPGSIQSWSVHKVLE